MDNVISRSGLHTAVLLVSMYMFKSTLLYARSR